MSKTPRYTQDDWELIGETPNGGRLHRLKIHNGWLVQSQDNIDYPPATTFVPFTPTKLPCVGAWNNLKREPDELVATTVATPSAEAASSDVHVSESATP